MMGPMCRLIISTLFIAGLLGGQQLDELPSWTPDEAMIRRAMHLEVLNRIAAKTINKIRGRHPLYDFRTNQAYEAVKGFLARGEISMETVAANLEELYRSDRQDPRLVEFRREVDFFSLGMGIEIKDTMQNEIDEIRAFLSSLMQLHNRLASWPDADRFRLELWIGELDLPSSILRRIREPVLPIPSRDNSSFSSINEIKKRITGRPADERQKPMFDLADEHAIRFSFVAAFLDHAEKLLLFYHRLTREIAEMIVP